MLKSKIIIEDFDEIWELGIYSGIWTALNWEKPEEWVNKEEFSKSLLLRINKLLKKYNVCPSYPYKMNKISEDEPELIRGVVKQLMINLYNICWNDRQIKEKNESNK